MNNIIYSLIVCLSCKTVSLLVKGLFGETEDSVWQITVKKSAPLPETEKLCAPSGKAESTV